MVINDVFVRFRMESFASTNMLGLNKLFRCICCTALWRRGLGSVCAWRILVLKFVVVGWFRQILLGLDESGQMLGLKLLVGPRWREFHCLAARPLSWYIEYGF